MIVKENDMSSNYVIEVKHLSKKFGNFYANKDINFAVNEGEIRAILGENGAGKSTLMKSLYGVHTPTEGEIFLRGKKVELTSPKVAIENGIGMVFQHFVLVDNFTVTENIILGLEDSKLGFLDMKLARKKIKNLIKKYNFNIDPDDLIENLSVGAQQKVEILKTLYRDANILILDEPTAVLTPQEIEELSKILKKLQKQGRTIIIITHKLKEVRVLSKKCTIIKLGCVIETCVLDDVDDDYLARRMVGRNLSKKFERITTKEDGEEILFIKNLTVKNEIGHKSVDDLTLSVKKGEILGIAGVDGNGQKELVEALIGLRKAEGGEILFHGEDISKLTPRKIFEKKITCIPENRQTTGLVLDYSIEENMVLRRYYEEKFQEKGFINFDKIREYAIDNIKKFDIRPTDPSVKISFLSGGNQQKVIIARELTSSPEFIIASQPTRGLDIGAIEYIHKAIMTQRNLGKAILLISFELDEIFSLSDRIAVIYNGKITNITKANEIKEMDLGLMMMGANR